MLLSNSKKESVKLLGFHKMIKLLGFHEMIKLFGFHKMMKLFDFSSTKHLGSQYLTDSEIKLFDFQTSK